MASPSTAVAERTETSARDRILAHAADLFLIRGYAETSVRDIAKAAGIKAASLYYHFESKDELLAEVLNLGVKATSDGFDSGKAACDQNSSGEERLNAAIHSHLSALFEHGPFTSAAVVIFPVAPDDVKDQVVPTRDAYEARWEQLFKDLADNDELNPATDLALARLVLLGALNSTLEWFDVTGPRSVKELADSIAFGFWRGMKP